MEVIVVFDDIGEVIFLLIVKQDVIVVVIDLQVRVDFMCVFVECFIQLMVQFGSVLELIEVEVVLID